MRNLWTKIKKCLQAEMLQKMWKEFLWIAQYARRYWKAMIFYTALGVFGTGVSLASSVISKDLVDIITGHQTGKLLQTFALMIGFSFGNTLISQASAYASTMINLKVDREIQNDIFAKILVTDWESLTAYHTGDLVTRWSSDASNISSGILNWLPNLVIYTVKFISALAIVVHYDPTFAIFALLGIPFSALLSRPLLRRMTNNNQRSAQMSAKLYGFNQEAFSNIQTIKAFDMIRFYVDRLKNLQQEYIKMRLDFQKMSIATSLLNQLSCILQLLRMGNLPCLERGNFLRNHDHVSVSVRYTDGFRQFAGQPCAIGDFSWHLSRPSDGYCGDAAGGLQCGSGSGAVCRKIPGKRHRACYGGLELYLPYGNRSVFESITGSVAA